jgi:hypothetical protein
MTLYQSTLAHLVWMAQMPGAKAHAWHRAQVLDKDESGLWTGIASGLEKQMNGLEKQSVSERQKPLKRP